MSQSCKNDTTLERVESKHSLGLFKIKCTLTYHGLQANRDSKDHPNLRPHTNPNKYKFQFHRNDDSLNQTERHTFTRTVEIQVHTIAAILSPFLLYSSDSKTMQAFLSFQKHKQEESRSTTVPSTGHPNVQTYMWVSFCYAANRHLETLRITESTAIVWFQTSPQCLHKQSVKYCFLLHKTVDPNCMASSSSLNPPSATAFFNRTSSLEIILGSIHRN